MRWTSAAAGTPSNIVGQPVGGSKLHIKLMETIYHPGFYRVALAVKSREELPPDLPNIKCEKCTVQIVQFMEEHGYNKDGGYTYHHCADVKITADPAKPTDKNWPGQ